MTVYTLGDRIPQFRTPNYFIADSAQVIGAVRLGDHASVWFNAVLRGDSDWIEIGDRSNVQDGTIIHADEGAPTCVGHRTSIGHMVLLHACTIGDDCLIGNGAIVLDRARIGRGSIVGAGTLITPDKEIPENVVVLGTPARVIREVTDKDRAMVTHASEHYAEAIAKYRRALKVL